MSFNIPPLIKAEWFEDGKVWLATSEDIPGLVVEMPDWEQLKSELQLVIPVLVELNSGKAALRNLKRKYGPSIPLNLEDHTEPFAICM